MYSPEISDLQDLEIIFRIRQLVGDEKELFIDEITVNSDTDLVKDQGSLYQLQEPKGYPLRIFVDGVEKVEDTVNVLNYKFLEFPTNTLLPGTRLVVRYYHFRHSDSEVILTYDTSATTYLTRQCNLSIEEIGIDLLTLATAYILLQKDLIAYTKSAVNLQDSDSRFDASRRPQYILQMLKAIEQELKEALEIKLRCKMLSLPVYRVE